MNECPCIVEAPRLDVKAVNLYTNPVWRRPGSMAAEFPFSVDRPIDVQVQEAISFWSTQPVGGVAARIDGFGTGHWKNHRGWPALPDVTPVRAWAQALADELVRQRAPQIAEGYTDFEEVCWTAGAGGGGGEPIFNDDAAAGKISDWLRKALQPLTARRSLLLPPCVKNLAQFNYAVFDAARPVFIPFKVTSTRPANVSCLSGYCDDPAHPAWDQLVMVVNGLRSCLKRGPVKVELPCVSPVKGDGTRDTDLALTRALAMHTLLSGGNLRFAPYMTDRPLEVAEVICEVIDEVRRPAFVNEAVGGGVGGDEIVTRGYRTRRGSV